MRGEHPDRGVRGLAVRGSSPHARGAPRPRSPWVLWAEAHPRMRGEHRLPGGGRRREDGSSPHARGARHGSGRRDPGGGLIPACAGSTRRRTPAPPGSRAHPRMRGEHVEQHEPVRLVDGSSPHARGALQEGRRGNLEQGLIPACAGSTRWAQAAASDSTAHPRMRGEHLLAPDPLIRGLGSSPHARGAHRLDPGRGRPRRLIPACAGSTQVGTSSIIQVTAHPRMRGEHSNVQVSVRSPPRLIPACAGSTQHDLL